MQNGKAREQLTPMRWGKSPLHRWRPTVSSRYSERNGNEKRNKRSPV